MLYVQLKIQCVAWHNPPKKEFHRMSQLQHMYLTLLQSCKHDMSRWQVMNSLTHP